MAKLDLDSSELEASRTAISNAITTFARADRVGDDVAGLTGHGGLAGKVQDFAGNWDHKRSQLQKGLESIRDMLQAIAETFEDLDRGMADQIRSAGFGGFGGPHGPGPLGKGGPILPPHTQGTIQDDGGMRPVGPAGSIGPIGPGGEIGPVTTVEPNIPGHPNAPGHPAAPVDSVGPVPPAAPEGPATNPPMNVGSLPDSRLPEDPEVCPPKVIDDEPRIATLPDRRLIEDVEMCDGYPTRDPDRVFETLPAIADFGPIHLDPTPNLQAYESESEGTR